MLITFDPPSQINVPIVQSKLDRYQIADPEPLLTTTPKKLSTLTTKLSTFFWKLSTFFSELSTTKKKAKYRSDRAFCHFEQKLSTFLGLTYYYYSLYIYIKY
jgi:hypothetical protein